jgi:Brp/Blh family beta-carotene 15,15'-monooxygenase
MNILGKHAKIVLIISIIIWILYTLKWSQPFLISLEAHDFTNIVCFFLILTLGISHGALDNIKGGKILKYFGLKNILIFYLSYVFIALCVIVLWFLFPTFTLVLFLIVACYHFGKEDTEFLITEKKLWHNLLFFLKGLLIILAPLYFHQNETLELFKLLGADTNFLLKFQSGLPGEYHHTLAKISFVGYLMYFYIAIKSKDENVHSLDFVPIIALNSVFIPLVAFTLYFCFIHSFKHSVSLMNMLHKKNLKIGFKKFVNKALPLTLITGLLFIIGIFFLANYYVLNDAILKVIFIGLASLTFPHILLEYLLEKNEK